MQGTLLAEQAWAVPIIFLTAHGQVADAVTAVGRVAFDFIEKPFADDALLEGEGEGGTRARPRTAAAQRASRRTSPRASAASPSASIRSRCAWPPVTRTRSSRKSSASARARSRSIARRRSSKTARARWPSMVRLVVRGEIPAGAERRGSAAERDQRPPGRRAGDPIIAGDAFTERFGRAPAAVADAPGRVNLIGEHTDYNSGLVLPVAIPQRVRVAVAPRADARVRLVTTAAAIAPAESGRADRLSAEVRSGRWSDYVQGCTDAAPCGGSSSAVASMPCWARRSPVGAGLASSAALEVAILRALRGARFELACATTSRSPSSRTAPSADFIEHASTVGSIRSPRVSPTRARRSSSMSRSLAWERIPLPADAELAVIDSGITHRHASGGCDARRTECERAAGLLGVASLRELGADAGAPTAELPAPLDRRVRRRRRSARPRDRRGAPGRQRRGGGPAPRRRPRLAARRLRGVDPGVDTLVALAAGSGRARRPPDGGGSRSGRDARRTCRIAPLLRGSPPPMPASAAGPRAGCGGHEEASGP